MVSIHGPLGYEPNTLATAPVRYVCKLHLAVAAKEQGLLNDVAPYLVAMNPQDQQAAPQLTGQAHSVAGSLLDEAWVPERHESTTVGGRSARVADRGFDPRTFGL